MPHKTTAIVFTAPGQVELREFDLPELGPDEILIKTLYTMVSSGTELRVFGGFYGADKNYPVIPGYSLVGEVVEIGDGVKEWKVGDLVSSRNPKEVLGIKGQWGGQASLHRVAATGHDQPILLPPGADPLDFVTAEISAISWRGARITEAIPGEAAVVIGQGLIGSFSAAWLASLGCQVAVIDRYDSRLRRAHKWGAVAALNPDTEPIVERLRALFPEGADIVVESAGVPAAAELAYRLLSPWSAARHKSAKKPRLLLQANYVDKVTINPFSYFPGEGVTVLTPMDRDPDDRRYAVNAHNTGKIRAADFVDRVLPFRDCLTAYAELRDHPEEHFSLVYDWRELRNEMF